MTSIALGAVGLVFAVSTWVTWAIVRPSATGVLPQSFAIIVMLVLSALWVVVLGMAVLAMVFGIVARNVGRLAHLGIGLGVLDTLLAAGGVLVFVLTASDWLPGGHTR
ncbi:MAG TPA: hypothetical protein VHC18_04355 [Amycolatopsis sp.]|nr:hypothetical protein [Amycolatopsis sp.]